MSYFTAVFKWFLVLIFVNCVISSALHGKCEKNEDCGTFDTSCRNGTCACTHDFVVIYDTCAQVTSPRLQCAHKSKCHTLLGQKSVCKDKKCVCKPFHHFYNNQCIKSRWLDENCEFDYQCYCGQNCTDNIECSNKLCSCKKGFKRVSRRCVRDLTEVPHQPILRSSGSTTVLNILILIFFFVKIL